jgi:hypothetical protein
MNYSGAGTSSWRIFGNYSKCAFISFNIFSRELIAIMDPSWEEVSHPHADDRKIDNSRSHDETRLDEHPCCPVDLEAK